MNTIGPKDPLAKIPQLTPTLSRFIEGMGLYFESAGVPRIGGRMLGLLMIAHWPLSAEDLATILNVSRGSISTNLRVLLASGMVEKALLPQLRTTHFVYSDEAMEQRILAGVKSTETFKRLLQQVADVVPPKDPARHHIDNSIAWSDLLIEVFHDATQRWRSRHPLHTHAHALTGGG